MSFKRPPPPPFFSVADPALLQQDSFVRYEFRVTESKRTITVSNISRSALVVRKSLGLLMFPSISEFEIRRTEARLNIPRKKKKNLPSFPVRQRSKTGHLKDSYLNLFSTSLSSL